MFDLLKKLGSYKILICAILLYPRLCPSGSFNGYKISPPDELVGSYTLNTVINKAEHLFTGLLKGPESLIILNGEMYTGIHGGEVVKLSNEGIDTIVKFGNKCDGQWQESICGRPFGLATDKNESLIVADAYYGIWKYNVKTKTKEILVPHNESIDNKVPKIFNSVAVSSNGDIYWTDSSTDVDIQNGVYAMFMDGSGRLLKYSATTKKSTVLADGLYFPTGVVISPAEDFVVVSEMIKSRLICYHIIGPKKGTAEVFLDNIPGFPDRLKVHSKYFTVALVHSRDATEPVFFQYISSHTAIRRFVVYAMASLESFFDTLAVLYSIFGKIVHKIGHFESVAGFAPQRVSVLIVSWEGKVMETWHNLDGSLTAVGDVQIFNKEVYYGSPYNEYVGKTPLPPTSLKLT